MIPTERALVSLHPERQAVLRAISYVSEMREKDPAWRAGGFPWVRTFMRFLTGDGRVTGKNINRIAFVQWSARSNLSTLRDWEEALDYLIATNGERCPSPISYDVHQRLFPEVAFQCSERKAKRITRQAQQVFRRDKREEESAELKRQNSVAQAEISLAFCTPENLSAWHERWSGNSIREWELGSMVWGWISRFPSLEDMDPEEWSAEPLWAVIGQVGQFARMRDERAKSLDAWLMPNKLPHRRG